LNRIAILQSSLKGKNDYFVVFNGTNINYLTGFPGATALLIPQTGQSTLYVSEVNFEQAKAETRGFNLQLQLRGENLMERIAKQTCPNKLAIDTLPIESWFVLAKAVGGEKKLEVAGNTVPSLRLVKDEEEIKRIREACNLAEIGMEAAIETIKPGVSERRVAAEVEYAMRKKGSDGTSFDTIIASGPSSAYPHGSCTNRIIHQGDLVIVDLGATFQSYRSDMTRTFIAGKSTEKQIKLYETVMLAQQRGFKAIAPNMLASRVDAVARQVIEAAGFGEFYVHGFGHGVGLEVHEPPILSPSSKDILAAGNVVTIEPGIYLPGYGGVRIEDTVLITTRGAERLTNGLYSLELRL
jgi:Xaa-Pro aminopeptidase